MSTELVVAAVASFLLAGVIKGLTGLGLPIAAVGVLSHFTDPRTAIALMILPIFLGNIWQIGRQGRWLASIRSYWLLATTLALVLGATVFAAREIESRTLMLVVGCVIVGFALVSLRYAPPPLPRSLDRTAQVAAGMLGGLLGGLTGIWAPPLVIYLLARRVDKEEFVRATGLLLLAGGIPLGIAYVATDQLTGERALASLGLVVPTLVGYAIGESLRRRLDTTQFRKLILFFFLAVGLNLARRALFA